MNEPRVLPGEGLLVRLTREEIVALRFASLYTRVDGRQHLSPVADGALQSGYGKLVETSRWFEE